MTWADVEQIGKIRLDRDRGWHIDFRAVWWPGCREPRRVRITQAPGYGRFETEHEAQKALFQIHARLLDGKPLYDILSAYLKTDAPENTVLHRWNHEFLPEQARKHARGKLSRKRKLELERYEGRGHLEFWEGVSLRNVDTPMVRRWLMWLEEKFPQLQPRTLKHLIADFGTFLRFEKTLGSVDKVPDLPKIDLPEHEKKVPERVDLDRILAEISEEIRGLWIARSLAGLRPSEARRLDVCDYDFAQGVLRIPGSKSKTRKSRLLPIRDVVPELDTWLQRWRATALGAEPLFVSPRAVNPEKRWIEATERLAWVNALKRLGFEHIRPNEGGRHAFVTHEIASGTDVYAVKDWAGHSSLASTEVYKSVTAVTLARRMRPRRSGPILDQAQKRAPKPFRKTQLDRAPTASEVEHETGLEPATTTLAREPDPEEPQ